MIRVMLSPRAAKAYVGAAVAAVAAATPIVDDGLAASELLTIAGAALIAFQAIFWTSNGKAEQQ